MVEIYRIKVDVSNYQWVMPVDSNFIALGGLKFEGRPRRSEWAPPDFYIYNPILDTGDFVHVSSGCFAFRERVRKNVRAMECIEMAGEILPIRLETGEDLYLLNVTECVNALDTIKSEYGTYWDIETETQKKGSVTKCAFHIERLSGSPVFKIPETVRAEVLATKGWSGLFCEDFISIYNEERFSGLIFEKVWSGIS